MNKEELHKKSDYEGVVISLSAEHKQYTQEVAQCFGDKIYVEANFMRFSMGDLPMQLIIGIAKWVLSNVAWDTIKFGIKKFYEKFPKGRATVRHEGIMFVVRPDNSVSPVVIPDLAFKYKHIQNIDDLICYLQNQNEEKPNIVEGWKEVTLDKVIDLIIDHRGLTPKKLGGDWSDIGYRAISAKSIKDGILVKEDQMNILPENLYKKWMKEEVQYGDIFLTSEAPLGEHIIWKTEEKVVLSQRIFGIRTNKEKLSPFYFNYFIESDYYQHELKSRESGSTVTGIKQSELLKTKLLLPPLHEQGAIADLLSSFDAKIELLREQNETLEKTAQTIFHEWFGRYSFDTPEGLPEGWRVGKLGEEFEIVMGQSPDGESYNETGNGTIFFQGRTDFTYRFPNTRLYTTEPKRLAEKFDVLVSVRAPVGDINVAIETCCIGRGLAAVKSKFKSYCLYKIKSLRESFDKFESEGTVFGSINKDAFFNIETLIPTQEMIIGFENIVKPMDEKFFNNYQAIQCLIKTRDTLLPKLMSGEVRITI